MDVRQIFAPSSRIQVVSATPEWTDLLLPATADARNAVMGFVRCALADLPDDAGEQLSLAADELLRNAIEHGGEGASSQVAFSYLRTPRMIQFRVKDSGRGFSMNNVEHAAISNPPEEPLRHAQYRSEKGMRPGGFGIMLVKQIADELIYNEVGNEVLLVKFL